MSQQLSGQFRRKRLLIVVPIAALVLVLTLAFRFFEAKSRIELQSHDFANRAIQRFDKLFSPLNITANNTLGLVGLPCDQIRYSLVEKLASLQTVRSILLVNQNRVYCSSLYGARDIDFRASLPELALSHQRMKLTVDKQLLKGSPILLLWTPKETNPHAGILQAINIEMMINYLLEPSLPWVERAVFNVGDRSLEYGNPMIEPVRPSEDEMSYQQASLRYPYTITLFGPKAATLAIATLPSQLPLALLLSALCGYIVWLATANRMSLSWQIINGINAREFMVYCQPLINARTNHCDGIELLLRWHNPRQGWIPPDVFIPLAERQNLIATLTRFVLKETARQLPNLPRHAEFHIAINVAASHFHQQAIINDLQTIWWPARPMPQLVVELTERDALPVMYQRTISDLQDVGVKLAIDDFGTGHSSLAYLKTLSPDVLKIDKVFTAAIGTDAINATVTDMVISLAQRLNIRLVAEGVETALQAEYLRQRGVDAFQGYFYAHPMPLTAFPQWLENWQQENVKA